jgi:hypothetical protein
MNCLLRILPEFKDKIEIYTGTDEKPDILGWPFYPESENKEIESYEQPADEDKKDEICKELTSYSGINKPLKTSRKRYGGKYSHSAQACP